MQVCFRRQSGHSPQRLSHTFEVHYKFARVISPDSRGEQNWYGSSPMGSQPKLVQDLVNGWPMIKANPATFIAIVVAIAFVEWVILHFWYRGRLSRERARVYEHHELTIVVETGSDCRTYAAGFEATLKEAGWDVHNWTIENSAAATNDRDSSAGSRS